MNPIKKYILPVTLVFAGLISTYAQASNPQGRKLPESITDATVSKQQQDTVTVSNEIDVELPWTIDYGFFKKTKEEDVTSSSSTYVPGVITYNNTQSISDFIDGFLPGVMGINNIRNLGNVLYVVDGIPGRDISSLTADEVERISVLKDVNALVLYGSQGRNGAIVITTKRGVEGRNRVSVSASYDVKTPVKYPTYLGSARYMQLYNEARMNDGLTALYDEDVIQNTMDGLNPYKYPDVDFYSDTYLKPYTFQTNVSSTFSGGNDRVSYFVNMDHKYIGTLEKLNPDANKGRNQFKIRGNLDFQINDWISSTVDISAYLDYNRRAHARSLDAGTTFRPNLYSPLIPTSYVSSIIGDQLSAIQTYDGYLLGGSVSYTGITPVADIYARGYVKSFQNLNQVANTLNFDLSSITKGLSAKTFLSLDYFNSYNLTINNIYNFYQPVWENDSIVALNALGQADRKDQTENASSTGFNFLIGAYAQLNYTKQINKDHIFNAALLGYTNSLILNRQVQKDKQSHLALSAAYSFRKKIFADFSSAYSHSIKLAENNRGGFSPTFGLGYLISEEDFLKDHPVIDHLKVKASGGILKTDINIDGYFLAQETYNLTPGSFTWADGQRSSARTILNRGQNLALDFEERKDRSVGFETSLFKSLFLEMNYFEMTFGNKVTQLSNTVYPSFYSAFTPWSNYNEDRYKGVELNANFTKSIGKVTAKIGVNYLNINTEVVKYDEMVQYDYLSRIGQPSSAILGLVSDGFYNSSDFTAEAPVPVFGEVSAGDLKYLDLNGDGLIDNNDRTFIGKSSFSHALGINLMLKYRSVSLFMLGRGRFGADGMRNGDYYWVDGDTKYSEVVLGRWTPETAETATYPRLSSKANSNNFRNSTFWLYDKSYFDIDRVQLTYEFNERICSSLGLENLSINISGTNLVKFAPHREYLELNVGGNPQFRSFMIGLRTSL